MADTEPFGKLTQTLIQHAILAPSSHNTQPWRFRASDSAIDLLADRTRALPVNDPHDRELTISCGAALMNLRIAAARHGLAVDVRLLPDREQPDWLARVAWAGRTEIALPEAELFECIARRRTYRKRFAPQAVDTDELDVLIDAASAEGARLRPPAHRSVPPARRSAGGRGRSSAVGQPKLAAGTGGLAAPAPAG